MTWVQDGIFAGGGEALPEGWADFAAQTGITAILHLRADAPAVFRGPSPASFLWLAIAAEDQAGLPDRLLAGAFVAACLERGQRVLLHASPGRHRTRWAYVAYRVWSGVAPGAARGQSPAATWRGCPEERFLSTPHEHQRYLPRHRPHRRAPAGNAGSPRRRPENRPPRAAGRRWGGRLRRSAYGRRRRRRRSTIAQPGPDATAGYPPPIWPSSTRAHLRSMETLRIRAAPAQSAHLQHAFRGLGRTKLDARRLRPLQEAVR